VWRRGRTSARVLQCGRLFEHADSGQHVDQEVVVVGVAARGEDPKTTGHLVGSGGKGLAKTGCCFGWVRPEVVRQLPDEVVAPVMRAGTAEHAAVGQLGDGKAAECRCRWRLERRQVLGPTEKRGADDGLGWAGRDAAPPDVDAASSRDCTTPVGTHPPRRRLSLLLTGDARRFILMYAGCRYGNSGRSEAGRRGTGVQLADGSCIEAKL